MTDRGLLERAAKAAGMECKWDQLRGSTHGAMRARYPGSGDAFPYWNPLDDDGDALRLAVALRMTVRHDDADACTAGWYGNQAAPTTDGRGPWFWKEWNSGDALASTRRAIVTAAAQMAGY